MDYSEIHRENELLETNLQEHLGNITWNERRVMAEKGEELHELRKQLDEITKVQNAVNSRQPGESTEVISRTRSLQYDKDTDVASLTKATRSQLRIQGERDKFSSKNLFNVRRWKSQNGFEFISSTKLLPASTMQTPLDKVDEHNNNKSNNETTLALQQGSISTKNYLQDTMSMLCGLRPMTAGYQSKQKPDDLLPPRSKSAVSRSRSRRELEIICRLTPMEQEPLITPDFMLDWNVNKKKQRSRALQQVRLENQELQGRIQIFMKNLERYRMQSLFSKTPDLVEFTDRPF